MVKDRDRDRDKERERDREKKKVDDREKHQEKEKEKDRYDKKRRNSNSSSDSSGSSDSESGSDSDRHKKRRVSSASESTDSERERKRTKKDKKEKKDKDKRKSKEGKEERRKRKEARRAEKKAAKKRDKRAREREKEELLTDYTNTDNPFRDNNLTQKFVWKLKREKQIEQGVDPEVYEKQGASRKEGLRDELAKLKVKREEREKERKLWEEERARMAREKEMENFDDWERKEEQFHLNQAKMRSELRIKEGRPKPIDVLYKNLNMDGDYEFEVSEPYRIFKGLSVQELEDLEKDITMYQELDREKNSEFWGALMIVCSDELEHVRGNRSVSGLHHSIQEDIVNLLKGKSYSELESLHKDVLKKIQDEDGLIDSEYWDALLKRLVVYKAKAKLREIHEDLLKKRLGSMEQAEWEKGKRERERAEEQEENERIQQIKKDATSNIAAKKAEELEENTGQYSPVLIHGNSLEQGEVVVDELEDIRALEDQRRAVFSAESKRRRMLTSTVQTSFDRTALSEEEMFKMESERYMGPDEERFNGEVVLETAPKQYWWHDKYRPRKPRFFNRVHTGYEWNKYNQTHYDTDNPPPKIVQGYKFNLFYPDLIDKTKVPTYALENGDTPDTKILRFHAGPPYEDIAFKIVNREWELSHKRGFKYTFERGILHLWFNFRRYRYRR